MKRLIDWLIDCFMHACMYSFIQYLLFSLISGMTLRDAYHLVRRKRSIIRPNVGFWKQLIEYENHVRKEETVRMVPSPFGHLPDVYEEEIKPMSWWVLSRHPKSIQEKTILPKKWRRINQCCCFFFILGLRSRTPTGFDFVGGFEYIPHNFFIYFFTFKRNFLSLFCYRFVLRLKRKSAIVHDPSGLSNWSLQVVHCREFCGFY